MTTTDLLWAAVVLLLAGLLFGCGNEALKINASIARSMLTVQSETGPAIRQARIDASVSAGRDVHDAGGTQDEAQRAATQATRRWQCAVDGHRMFALAVGSYIDALALWANGEAFELVDILPFVRRAIDSYRVLSSCARSLGSQLLPEAPAFFDLIPPTWSVSP